MFGENLALPVAWVVTCKKCSCTINCRAIDPQTEHSQRERADPPPQDPVLVTCSCCWSAFRYAPSEVSKGSPGPGTHCYERKMGSNNKDKEERKEPGAGLLIAASFIAAVRLSREEIKSSPVVHSKIAESIRLAEMIRAKLRL